MIFSSLVSRALKKKVLMSYLILVIEGVTKTPEGSHGTERPKKNCLLTKLFALLVENQDIENLGLEKLGVNLEKDAVLVDDYRGQMSQAFMP